MGPTSLALLLFAAPPDTPLPDVVDEPATEPAPTRPDDDEGEGEGERGFFGPELAPGQPPPGGEAPPMPAIEELPSRDPDVRDDEGDEDDEREPGRLRDGRKILDWDPDRPPAGSDGGSFFDPGKLTDTGPGGGGLVQLRGYVGGAFVVTERSNTRERNDEGNIQKIAPLPFFGAGTATIYVGAAIWADAIYARVSLEYLSIPRVTAGTEDILAPARRDLLVESAALEVNPFVWAEHTPRWFREGFKITGGVFIVPFGIEDEEHAAPIQWFTTRARSMTNGRVYPGTWSDVGAMVQWKPTFMTHRTTRARKGEPATRRDEPIRPIELTAGLVNGDPCTQTRFTDALYNPTGVAAPCERVRRPAELGDAMAAAALPGQLPRADVGFLGIGPDNNRNKAVFARLSLYPLPAFYFGGSFVWAKHPRQLDFDERIAGKTTVDVPQAASWRAGAHVDLDLDQIVASPYPLPMLRAEFVIGTDAAPPARSGEAQPYADRHMIGAYAQIAQPLYRRKRSNLPGLMLQYRIDWADPDRAVPGRAPSDAGGSVPLLVDPSDGYLYDETQLAHVIGLRWLVVPRFTIKADYTLIREDGGRVNQLANDRFILQVVGDF
ncbi:hypothetical protein ACNOYE_01860 [Nannocystaceae bacterium ST9]